MNKNGKLLYIDSMMEILIQTAIEELAKNPELKDVPADQVAVEIQQGIRNTLETITLKQFSLYFDLHRKKHHDKS